MTAPPEQAEVVDFLRGLAGSDPLETHIYPDSAEIRRKCLPSAAEAILLDR
jgi:hypothetical protein